MNDFYQHWVASVHVLQEIMVVILIYPNYYAQNYIHYEIAIIEEI